MVLANFLDNGLLVHTVHEFTEEEKEVLLAQGYHEITDEDLELYETLRYGYDFETGKPKEFPTFEPSVEEYKTQALSRIDSATSAAILAGFEYEIDGEVLHFSYDSFDQQNFADTANAAMLAMQGVEGVPQTVTWNGWRNHNAESKGELVRLVLDVQTFLALYTGGALVHKAVQMEVGGQRKAAIEAAETVEAINALMQEWGI